MKTSMNRQDFLGLLVGVPALGALGQSAVSAQQAEPVATAEATAFADRVFDDTARMLGGALSYVGDRLGLFKAIAQLGECTPKQLAQAVNCNERLIAEWLKAMMALEYVEYLPEPGLYRLSPEQSAVLADENSPLFMGGALETTVPQVMATHQVMEAFRTGKPITPDIFHPDFWEGINRANGVLYEYQLVQKWLPAMPGVVDKLKAGGAAADVGCGQGNAAIVLARAFPKAKIAGSDPFRPSIEQARRAAREAGVDDRVKFVVGSPQDLPAGQFDLVTTFFIVHHMSRPIRDLTSIRKALAPDGSYLIFENNLSDNLHENVTTIGRLSYSASTLSCLHDSMANSGAALGPVTERQLRELIESAEFSRFRRLPIESPYDALYEAKA